jgi:hypothetical protein
MTDDDIKQALQAVKATQAAEFEAINLKLDALLVQRDQAAEAVDRFSDRLSGTETGWVNTFRDQAARITALEARIANLEAS